MQNYEFFLYFCGVRTGLELFPLFFFRLTEPFYYYHVYITDTS